MCDYNEYSIVGAEFCVSVEKILSQHDHRRVLCFRTDQTSWEFTIDYNAQHNMDLIGINNIHALLLNPSQSELNEPLAEIVIWRWNNNQQEIINTLLFKRNENKRSCVLSSKQQDEVHFTIRPISKRKLPKHVCRPLDFLASDVLTIWVRDQKFVVSANRLMQVSPVFRAMLMGEMREKLRQEVEVKDAEPEHFRTFLEVIDHDQDVRPNPTNVVGVLKLADRYQVKLAKQRCEEHLLNCVELPLIERLRLADKYQFNKLKDSILSIGPAKLRTLYKSNSYEMLEEGRFSKKLLSELILRLCDNE